MRLFAFLIMVLTCSFQRKLLLIVSPKIFAWLTSSTLPDSKLVGGENVLCPFKLENYFLAFFNV